MDSLINRDVQEKLECSNTIPSGTLWKSSSQSDSNIATESNHASSILPAAFAI